MIDKYWGELISMCEFEHYPFENHCIIFMIKNYVFSYSSLALHCTNVNSIFGLSPTIDCKKIWEENKLLN